MMFRWTAATIHSIRAGIRFRLPLRVIFAGALLFAGILSTELLSTGVAFAGARMAVIPKQTIYPGETVDAARLEEVEVTNPNLAGDYATSTDQVAGKITTRTLLAGRVILTAGLREPYAVERGKMVRLTFISGPLMISASGSPLDNAAVGDLIRVRNTDSGIIVSGTVMADGTIQVVAK